MVTRILGDCPGCGGIRKYGNVSVRKDHILRGCWSCRYSERVPLPPVRKKILYLDQFFFCGAFQDRDRRFVEAVQRIGQLSAEQLLAVPFSSVHEDETHQWRGYSGKDKDDLMGFIKSTARGHEFKPVYEVELTQIVRAFQAFLSGAPATCKLQHDDAVDDEIRAWDDYVWIDVGRYMGDTELMRDLKRQSIETLLDAFENWRRSTNTFDEQVALEMREAARGYIVTYAEYASRIASGDFDAVWNAPLLSRVVESLLHCLPVANVEERLKSIGKFFASEHFAEVPHVWMTARIYACLKDMVKRGAFKNRNDAKSRLSGLFQDIKHVATYSSYCDAFLMDKAMAHVVADPRINLQSRFGVKVFSLNNWDQFLAWLNDLESGMSSEHRAALSAAY